jgi:hypothetical protein
MILEIQKLQFSRSYECFRKQRLIRDLLLPSLSSTNSPISFQRHYHYWMNKDTLALTLQKWESEVEIEDHTSGSAT